jgi:hypothetical protein
MTADRDRRRTLTRRPGHGRCAALLLAVICVLIATAPAPADIAQSIDAGDLNGRVTVDEQGTLTVTPDEGDATTMHLADVHRVVFGDNLVVRSGDVLLIDADVTAVVTQTIKLRAGLHHIVLPYWQGPTNRTLDFSVSGPGFPGGEVPPSHFYCFREAGELPEPSIGIDEQGYRLPELALDMTEDDRLRRRIRYTYLVGEPDGPWEDFSVFSRMQERRGGVAGGITYRMAGQSEFFGIIFHGFIKIDQDGEYAFTINCDDGARLYFGQLDQFQAGIPPSVDAPEWAGVTRYGTRVSGKLATVADGRAAFSVPINEQSDLELDLGLETFAELWAADTDVDQIDRGGESEVDDTAYIRDRNNEGNVLKVPGTVVSLDAEFLRFDYRGQVRQISRDRVLGLVLNSADRPRAETLGYHQTLHLKTGQSFPGRLVGIDAQHIRFDLVGGQRVRLARGDVFMVRNEQGRVIDLTAVEPTAVEEVPYFDHVIPYRRGTAFDGGPIRLFDDKEYADGYAVHSRNRLHFRLDGGYTGLRAGVGLLKPGGRTGNVTARVLGDGEVLWEHDNLTADDGRVDLDLDLTGVDRLVLEIDFGAGQHVGDRAAWVEPLLIRDAVE